MAPVYEFEGKTTEEAASNACEELGLSEDQLDIEVISYGSTGIFGLVGVRKAKIRVTVTVPESPEEESKKSTPSPEDQQEVAEMAKYALEKIISFVVDDATVSVTTESESIRLQVEGGNSALLIGKHGKTLDALQYIVQRIVYKQKRTKVLVSIDVEGYRDRRKASLTQLALRLGDKVKRSGRPATIRPMSAYDRRIVHVALKNNTSVRTQSIGTGSFRKLVIYPERKQRRSDSRTHPENSKGLPRASARGIQDDSS